MSKLWIWLIWLGIVPGAGHALAAEVPDVPAPFGVDAPELAPPGKFAVGVRVLRLVQRAQVDVLAIDARGAPTRADRELIVDVWYPASPSAGAARAVYAAQFPSEPPAAPMSFAVSGVAVRDARPAARQCPLVVVSHGYSNDPAAMIWITENLASKGYVVAAIRHDDPPITDRGKFAALLLRRPLDIVFVTAALKKSLAAENLIDPARVALIGYSMGGYGVLTAAGAELDPSGPPAHIVPGGSLQPYTHGGSRQDEARIPGILAVVAIAPAGGGSLAAWGAAGLRGIQAPLLLIAGDHDRTVDYLGGARAIFDDTVGAQRYLLTFQGAGHSIGLGPAPEAMRARLWDQDWFEDPVWRKERLNAIEAHFITAFLDLYVKGEDARATYLDVSVTQSSAGTWAVPPGKEAAGSYDAYSTGTDGVTVWKGFQRRHAEGLELLKAAPISGAGFRDSGGLGPATH